jgi:hypothetical protein
MVSHCAQAQHTLACVCIVCRIITDRVLLNESQQVEGDRQSMQHHYLPCAHRPMSSCPRAEESLSWHTHRPQRATLHSSTFCTSLGSTMQTILTVLWVRVALASSTTLSSHTRKLHVAAGSIARDHERVHARTYCTRARMRAGIHHSFIHHNQILHMHKFL